MKAELYMTSPEQEFAYRTMAGQPVEAMAGPQEALEAQPQQWAKLEPWQNWLQHNVWRYVWQFHWRYVWRYVWRFHFIDFPERPELQEAEVAGEGTPGPAVKPILERLLLRREREGFLALDSSTNRVFKLDQQAGEFVRLVQDGSSHEDAAKKMKLKKQELDEFLAFVTKQDVPPAPWGHG